ncbi:MAG: hypothetical protein QY309_04640 [Cyclobacteriaceae bacterium]|nr:MAG: hypothetical protein QY309_04640 [Cyclobacteriaceae bacterium]
MTVNITPNPRLHEQTIDVLALFQRTGRYDLKQFLHVLNQHEDRHNIYRSSMEQLINNPKSKYHLLYSLSGAIHFQGKILNAQP